MFNDFHRRNNSMSPVRQPKRCRTIPTYDFETSGLTSTARGKHAFKWLLSGLSPTDFFKTYFEKKPTLRHNPPTKFRQLISTCYIQDLLSSGRLHYTTDIDVTKYTVESGRQTLNKEAGVAAKDAWRMLSEEGCSLRLLRPQQHCDALWRLCAHLEEFLGCAVGVNVYVTPGGSQGFAPHFDDVDAFVCQVEGRKRWRVYGARGDGGDDLPRVSSVDFDQEDVKGLEVLYDRVLEEGDMLYLPRGRIHQAEGVEGVSLHVTVSMYQKWTWADFLLESFKMAVESAAREDRLLRRGLPLRFGEFVGVGCGEGDVELRKWFEQKVRKVVNRVGELWPTDAGGDRMMERFMRERLPPALPQTEKGGKRGEVVGMESVVRAKGAGMARVVMGEDGLPKLIHCLENSRGASRGGSEGLTCLPEEALAMDIVLKAYPEGLKVGELAMEKAEDRVELAQGLVEIGVLQVVAE